MKQIPVKQFWAVLATYLRPQWRKVALLAALILTGTGIQIANPQIIRYFIDTARADGPLERMLWAGLFFLGSALLLQITTVASTYVGEDVGWTATNQLREDLALHCLKLDMTFHNDRTPGEMIERIDGDIANLAIFFAQFVVRVIGSLLLLFGVLIALAFEDWRISLMMAIYAGGALWGLVRMRNIATPFWKQSREASAELFGFLEEQLAGTEDIRSSGATPFVMRDLFRFNRMRLASERKAGVVNTFMVMTWMGLYTLGQAIALVSGWYFFGTGVLTIGAVYLLVSYTDAIFRPLEQITNEIQNLQKAAASIERVQELLVTSPQITDGAAGLLPDGPLGVAFGQVHFSYEATRASADPSLAKPEATATLANSASPVNGVEAGASNGHEVTNGHALPATSRIIDEPVPGPPAAGAELPTSVERRSVLDGPPSKVVIHDLSFRLAPGEVLGLLGRTGSGKTTVTRLLFRLYDPQAGGIRLWNDDSSYDLRDIPLDDLRSKVGIVTQDVQLFRASVRDNLTFFDRTIGDAQIMDALDELGMGEWVRRLPAGLDTELSSGGQGLSAGEAQLLAFTRVFLRDPGLVILDEASSRLDPATEQLIEQAVDRLMRGRTGIIIAHRLATVHRADEILILEGGQVREFGRYRDLVNDPESRFSQLLRAGMEEVLA
jgi:ABC-type multidrug transport system fused ATPase/permease subunit